MDTVTLAKKAREEQGPWEAEVSYGGEGDLHQLLNDCDKNPGHQTFVPVDQFNMDHLPPGCRDNDLLDLVRAMSDLTVRVSVKHVSERRPETVPGSDKPFPTYKGGGRNMLRTGTGWVMKVVKYPNESNSSRICKCRECLDSTTPKAQFAVIYIQTAAHVVYDELEAAHTTCHLFFDKGGKLEDCSGVRAFSDWDFEERGEGGDWCNLVHVTHDLDLADLLYKMAARWDDITEKVNDKCRRLMSGVRELSSSSEYLREIWEKVNNKYRRLMSGGQELSSQSEYPREIWEKVNTKYRQLMSGGQVSSSPSENLREAWDKLTIIMSHPHGCNKQVSVGYWTDWRVGNGSPTSISYTTPTCPGSSGAPLFVMWDAELRFCATEQVHCGNCEDDTNLNFSNFGWF